MLPSRIVSRVLCTLLLFSFFKTNSLIRSVYWPELFFWSSTKKAIKSWVNKSSSISFSGSRLLIYSFNRLIAPVLASSAMAFALSKAWSETKLRMSTIYVPFSLVTKGRDLEAVFTTASGISNPKTDLSLFFISMAVNTYSFWPSIIYLINSARIWYELIYFLESFRLFNVANDAKIGVLVELLIFLLPP